MGQHSFSRVLCGFLCGFLIACSESTSPQLKVHVGQTFPNLELSDLHNKPVELKMASGRLLVLNFWATWCPPCRHEMPSLDRLSHLLDSDRVAIVGISMDSDDHLVREFLLERKIFFRNLMDRDMTQTTARIGIRVFPSTFYVGPDGKLLKVDEGGKVWDTPEVVREIKSLLAAYDKPLKNK